MVRDSFERDKTVARVDEARMIAERVGWSGLGFDGRACLLSAAVAPKALYACAIAALPARPLARLRQAVCGALWGQERRLRCKEVVFTLLSMGHRLDPEQRDEYESLVGLRRMLANRVDLHGGFLTA